jgi:hypothetical protein
MVGGLGWWTTVRLGGDSRSNNYSVGIVWHVSRFALFQEIMQPGTLHRGEAGSR